MHPGVHDPDTHYRLDCGPPSLSHGAGRGWDQGWEPERTSAGRAFARRVKPDGGAGAAVTADGRPRSPGPPGPPYILQPSVRTLRVSRHAHRGTNAAAAGNAGSPVRVGHHRRPPELLHTRSVSQRARRPSNFTARERPSTASCGARLRCLRRRCAPLSLAAPAQRDTTCPWGRGSTDQCPACWPARTLATRAHTHTHTHTLLRCCNPPPPAYRHRRAVRVPDGDAPGAGHRHALAVHGPVRAPPPSVASRAAPLPSLTRGEGEEGEVFQKRGVPARAGVQRQRCTGEGAAPVAVGLGGGRRLHAADQTGGGRGRGHPHNIGHRYVPPSRRTLAALCNMQAWRTGFDTEAAGVAQGWA